MVGLVTALVIGFRIVRTDIADHQLGYATMTAFQLQLLRFIDDHGRLPADLIELMATGLLIKTDSDAYFEVDAASGE